MYGLTARFLQYVVGFWRRVVVVYCDLVKHLEIPYLSANQGSLFIYHYARSANAWRSLAELIAFHFSFSLRFLIQVAQPGLIVFAEAIGLSEFHDGAWLEVYMCLKASNGGSRAPFVPEPVTVGAQNAFTYQLVVLWGGKVSTL